VISGHAQNLQNLVNVTAVVLVNLNTKAGAIIRLKDVLFKLVVFVLNAKGVMWNQAQIVLDSVQTFLNEVIECFYNFTFAFLLLVLKINLYQVYV